jgi:hypothetical protein
VTAAFLHVNLCTYADLAPRGDLLEEFVAVAVDLARRSGMSLRIATARWPGTADATGRRWSRGAWERCRAKLSAGAVTSVFIFNDLTAAKGTLPEEVASFLLSIQAADVFDAIIRRVRTPEAVERIRQAARPSPRFLNLAIQLGEPALELEREDLVRLVAVTGETFRGVDGACGFVTLDPFSRISGQLTEYEIQRHLSWANEPDRYQTKLRGAFWGNLLSPRHVEQLGGIATVTRDAPCVVVEPLTFSARGPEPTVGAYLQLTDWPSDVTTDRAQQLTDYLSVLLA